MTDVIIRNANTNDAEGIANVHVKTWQCAYRGLMPDELLDGLSVEGKTKTWKTHIEKPDNAQIFVAEKDNKIVGWLVVGKSRDEDAIETTGELHGIYIDPQYIGKGIGSMLMETALSTLKKEGYSHATLWVLTSNEKTRKFYEKKGWKIEGKTKEDNRNGHTLHETRYSKNL